MQQLDLRNNFLTFVSPEDFHSLASSNRISLDRESLHHIRRVLRISGEPQLNITCGDGQILVCKLSSEDKVEKISDEIINFPRKVRASLMNPGIKKKNLEYLIQKATEIGLDSIYFISSSYQNFPVESTDKYTKIAESACVQSKNPWLPNLQKIKSDLINFPYKDDTMYIWGDPDQEAGIEQITPDEIKPYSEVCFINGCEGGWSPVEIDFLKNRFRSVRLSDNVLRTETAAVVAASYIKLLIRNL